MQELNLDKIEDVQTFTEAVQALALDEGQMKTMRGISQAAMHIPAEKIREEFPNEYNAYTSENGMSPAAAVQLLRMQVQQMLIQGWVDLTFRGYVVRKILRFGKGIIAAIAAGVEALIHHDRRLDSLEDWKLGAAVSLSVAASFRDRLALVETNQKNSQKITERQIDNRLDPHGIPTITPVNANIINAVLFDQSGIYEKTGTHFTVRCINTSGGNLDFATPRAMFDVTFNDKDGNALSYAHKPHFNIEILETIGAERYVSSGYVDATTSGLGGARINAYGSSAAAPAGTEFLVRITISSPDYL